jgi:hypothetical protein
MGKYLHCPKISSVYIREVEMVRFSWMLSCLILLLAAVSDRSTAIPSFARKYNMSCMSCHAPFPGLKPSGKEFASNGFQLPGRDSSTAGVDTGDDQLFLMPELPLSLRMEGYGRWQPQDAGRSDFEAPYLLKLISGGQIAPDIVLLLFLLWRTGGSGRTGGCIRHVQQPLPE